jgi:hypothetical protein
MWHENIIDIDAPIVLMAIITMALWPCFLMALVWEKLFGEGK